MSLITHVILIAFSLGTMDQFNPAVLGLKLFTCMTLWSLEAAIFKLIFYLQSASTPFFELLAFTGYKFVGLAITDLVKIFMINKVIANCGLGYLCLMMVVFMVYLNFTLISTKHCPGT